MSLSLNYHKHIICILYYYYYYSLLSRDFSFNIIISTQIHIKFTSYCFYISSLIMPFLVVIPGFIERIMAKKCFATLLLALPDIIMFLPLVCLGLVQSLYNGVADQSTNIISYYLYVYYISTLSLTLCIYSLLSRLYIIMCIYHVVTGLG